jgi:hypothetical protein
MEDKISFCLCTSTSTLPVSSLLLGNRVEES